MSARLPGQRKKLSGSERKKLKKTEEERTAELAKRASTIFKPVVTQGSSVTIGETSSENRKEDDEDNFDEDENNALINDDIESEILVQNDDMECMDSVDNSTESNREDKNFDTSDPSEWPSPLTDSLRAMLISVGPNQKHVRYPDKNGSSFNDAFFTCKKFKGEVFNRDWLVFSEKSNSLFCFPCSIFGSSNSPWSNIGDEGFSDFKNKGRSITMHETSDKHFENNKLWKLYIRNHAEGLTLNALNETKVQSNITHWKEVLRGILDCVLFLSKNNLAFRGKSSIIGKHDCGNFLQLVQFLSKYYPPLGKHVMRLKKQKTSYLSAEIQNEFIDLCGNEVLTNVKSRKYYSIMFDSTPDCSRQEQIGQIIRTVKCSRSGCRVEENFIEFISETKKTGLELSKIIIDKLQSDGLEIANCRGQGYDYGSNMSGIYKGVQKWITDSNNLAYYIPCAAHSLNLVGVNSAERTSPAKLALGQMQNIFQFFSSSPARWEILKSKLKVLLKGQSTTRWSARAQAVNAMHSQYLDVVEVLTEMVTGKVSEFNAQTVASADSLLSTMLQFKFLLSVVIWDNILFKIDICNRSLQEKSVDIDRASKLLQALLDWLKDFQKSGFDQCHLAAIDIADACGIDTESGFSDVRSTRGKKRQMLGEEVEYTSMTNIERYEIEFFKALTDNLICEFNNRFMQIKDFSELFGFLWGKVLDSLPSDELEKHAKDLCMRYPDDLAIAEFVNEVKFLKFQIVPFIPKEQTIKELGPLDVLNIIYQNCLESVFANVETALRIFLTMPVTVATNERAFSKLKLIKNYLRSVMGQERLSNLAIISIEYALADLVKNDRKVITSCEKYN